jgi:hypothetical protein
MSFQPQIRLYNAAGDTLVYTFKVEESPNLIPASAVGKSTEHKGPRGIGSTNIDMGVDSWDLQLECYLNAVDYTAVTTLLNTLFSTVLPNTAYVLKIDSSVSTTWDYRVKLIQPINAPAKRRTGLQRYTVIFKVNAW